GKKKDVFPRVHPAAPSTVRYAVRALCDRQRRELRRGSTDPAAGRRPGRRARAAVTVSELLSVHNAARQAVGGAAAGVEHGDRIVCL
ncbi:unnamed protein product, partial [Urochloa humidicola]